MELTIFNEKVNTTEKIVFSGNTVQELLNLLKINSETVLVSRNNEIITEEEVLPENDKCLPKVVMNWIEPVTDP